jgi:hypothetical protein
VQHLFREVELNWCRNGLGVRQALEIELAARAHDLMLDHFTSLLVGEHVHPDPLVGVGRMAVALEVDDVTLGAGAGAASIGAVAELDGVGIDAKMLEHEATKLLGAGLDKRVPGPALVVEGTNVVGGEPTIDHLDDVTVDEDHRAVPLGVAKFAAMTATNVGDFGFGDVAHNTTKVVSLTLPCNLFLVECPTFRPRNLDFSLAFLEHYPTIILVCVMTALWQLAVSVFAKRLNGDFTLERAGFFYEDIKF